MVSSQGSNANHNGSNFEKEVYGVMFYKIAKNYQMKSVIKDQYGNNIIYCELWKNNNLCCIYSSQDAFRKEFLRRYEIFPKKKKKPDGSFYFPDVNHIFILEIKKQSSPGSVDEKLGLGVFLRDQVYKKILKSLNCTRDISYVLDPYFKNENNEDYFEFMDENNIKYNFGKAFPLQMVGLEETIPTSDEEIKTVIENINKDYDEPLFDLF